MADDKKKIWIEVFRAGKQTDSAGNSKDWTEADLDTIVDKYNNQDGEDKHEAPVVLGHPQTDSPAYGWVESLKREGNLLFAQLKDLKDDFVQWVKDGHYKKRSISLYNDMNLKHVGFLGGTPPAIKGLTDPAFKAEEKDFSTYEMTNTETTNQESDEKVSGEPPADSDRNSPPIHDLSKSKINIINHSQGVANMQSNDSKHIADEYIKLVANFCKTTYGDEVAEGVLTVMEKNKTIIKGAPATNEEPTPQFNEFANSKEYKEMQKEIEQVKRTNQKLQEQNLKIATEAYFNEQKAAGQLVPAQRQIVELAFEVARKGSTVTYTFSDETMDGETVIKQLIASFDKKIELSEFAYGNAGEEDFASSIKAAVNSAQQR